MPIKHVSRAFAKLQKKISALQEQILKNTKEVPHPEHEVTLPSEDTADRIIMEISIWSAIKVILLIFTAILAFSFLERITSILIVLFISVFLSTTLNPGVDRLEKWHIPRSVGVIIVMVLVLSIFFGILGGLFPIIGGEVAKMWEGLTDFAAKLGQRDFSSLPLWMQNSLNEIIPTIQDYVYQISPEELQSTITNFVKDNIGNYLERVSDFAGKGLSLVAAFFGGLFQTLLVLILTFFLVVEKGNIAIFFVQLFPQKYEEYIVKKGAAVQHKVSEWVHGQIMLFVIIALIAYIGLTILGVKYAITLALIAGLAEFFPYIGPFVAFASAAPVAFNESLSLGIATMIFYAGIQMVEGNIIVPLVMKKAVGLSPIVTIIAMLIGWEFLGIIGMIISIPVASVISLFVTDFSGRKRT